MRGARKDKAQGPAKRTCRRCHVAWMPADQVPLGWACERCLKKEADHALSLRDENIRVLAHEIIGQLTVFPRNDAPALMQRIRRLATSIITESDK